MMNIQRQLPVTVSSRTAMGAARSAPSGVPSRPSDAAKPRSRTVAQFAMVRLMVENVGPSATPKSTRKTAKPAMADPPNSAMPMFPAKAIPISKTDQSKTAQIQTQRGPFRSASAPPTRAPAMYPYPKYPRTCPHSILSRPNSVIMGLAE
ncbi:hypothetical protein QFZ61_003321 [Arthrobacter sp. B3I4]|nr:hypothetical protein [Arthrobacter sp. B3I4]